MGYWTVDQGMVVLDRTTSPYGTLFPPALLTPPCAKISMSGLRHIDDIFIYIPFERFFLFKTSYMNKSLEDEAVLFSPPISIIFSQII